MLPRPSVSFCCRLLLLVILLLQLLGKLSARFEFADYPHLQVFDGRLRSSNTLTWITQRADVNVPAGGADSLTGQPDVVQRVACREGVVRVKQQSLHLFSTNEARACLANRTIAVVGDSYMRIFYIAIADILIGHPGDNEGTSREGRLFLHSDRSKRLQELRAQGAVSTSLLWLFDACYYESLGCLLRELDAVPARNLFRQQPVHALFLNSLTHSLPAVHGSTTAYNAQLSALFRLARRDLGLNLTWVAAPHVSVKSAPSRFQNVTAWLLGPMATSHIEAAKMARANGAPFFDFRTISGACTWSNCTADGQHRARFVMRMAAQMLLANLCRPA